MQLRRDLRTPGGLLAAPLGIALLDTAGINVDAIGRCAPTQIDVTVFDAARDVEAVRFFGEIVREGRSQMFTRARDRRRGAPRARDRVRLHELGGAGADAARFRLRRPRARRRRRARPPAPHRRVRRGASPRRELRARRPLRPGRCRLAASRPDPGDARSRRPRRRRDAAATDAIYAEHTGATLVQRGKTGPFVATAHVLADNGPTVACLAELRDDGEGGRIVATGFSLYRRA